MSAPSKGKRENMNLPFQRLFELECFVTSKRDSVKKVIAMLVRFLELLHKIFVAVPLNCKSSDNSSIIWRILYKAIHVEICKKRSKILQTNSKRKLSKDFKKF